MEGTELGKWYEDTIKNMSSKAADKASDNNCQQAVDFYHECIKIEYRKVILWKKLMK